MASKVGTLIKNARTAAGLTQEQLAKKVSGVSAADISKAERGEKELDKEQLKAIAKATGVTQKSLLEAAAGKTSSAKPSSAKTSSAKNSSAKNSSAKTASGKTSSSAAVKLTSAEKELLSLYRKADKETKEKVLDLLKKENASAASPIMAAAGNILSGLIAEALGSAKQ